MSRCRRYSSALQQGVRVLLVVQTVPAAGVELMLEHAVVVDAGECMKARATKCRGIDGVPLWKIDVS